MLPPVRNNISLYNATAGIEKNSILNRSMMETVGIDVPFAVMANNKEDMIERATRSACFVFVSFIAPVISMPFINKMVLKKSGILNKPENIHILRVSKKYLTENTEKMLTGINKTAEEFKDRHKNLDKTFDGILDNFEDKEKLRKTLIKVHERIYQLDYAVSSVLCSSIPWIGNYITEKRTGRKGYVGEFKMADEKYTDAMSNKHENSKRIKLAISYATAAGSAILFPKYLAKTMIQPDSKLNFIGKFLKKNAHLFDYTGMKYMSKAALLAVMTFGDSPTYLLACRDKHELKYKGTGLVYMMTMLFGGEPIFNNVVGRLFDKYLGTTIMNSKGFENAGFFKKLLLQPNKLEKINHMQNASKLTKRLALGMYWGNFALTTTLLGFGLPYILNKGLKNDVTQGQKNLINNTKISNLTFQNFLNMTKNLSAKKY